MRQDRLFDHMLAMPPSSLHKQSSPVYSGYSKGYFWPILVHFPLAGVLLSRLCRLKNMVGLYSHNLTRLRSPLLFKIIYGQNIIYNNVNLQCPWSSYSQRRKNVIVELQFTHRHISTFSKVFDSFLFTKSSQLVHPKVLAKWEGRKILKQAIQQDQTLS